MDVDGRRLLSFSEVPCPPATSTHSDGDVKVFDATAVLVLCDLTQLLAANSEGEVEKGALGSHRALRASAVQCATAAR